MQMQTDSRLGKTERWRGEQVISLTDYKISYQVLSVIYFLSELWNPFITKTKANNCHFPKHTNQEIDDIKKESKQNQVPSK